MNPAVFDSVLDLITDDQAYGTGVGVATTQSMSDQKAAAEYFDTQLLLARADPAGWIQAHRKDIRLAAGRRRVRRIIAGSPEMSEFTAETLADGENFLEACETGDFSFYVNLSDERKARLHRWIVIALPVLKRIATYTPMPYNFAVIGFIILLIIIDERRLKPPEVTPLYLGE